jgi:hypothetical protein
METFDGAPAPINGMDPEEILRRSKAFDPTQLSAEQKVRIFTLALEIIQRFSYDPGATAVAAQALREIR